jgi:hypothetical protein
MVRIVSLKIFMTFTSLSGTHPTRLTLNQMVFRKCLFQRAVMAARHLKAIKQEEKTQIFAAG